MTRRITLTLSEEELEKIERLRSALSPDASRSSFAGDALMAAIEAELHGIECQCQQMAQALFMWQPEGRAN